MAAWVEEVYTWLGALGYGARQRASTRWLAFE